VLAFGVAVASLTLALDGSSGAADVAQASVDHSSAAQASDGRGPVARAWSQPIHSEEASARVDQQTATPANQPDDKPVEQTRKNIQVLKGLPDSQLLPMMQLFAASLGVRCESCHVRTPAGQWEFDKDDKKMKQTARKMIQMTQDINKTSFEGKTEVTCYACHHGSEHPVNAPVLPVALETPAGARSNEPWPTPQQILARYVEAVGGKEAAGKIQSRSIKGSFVAPDGSSVPMELSYQSPSKLVSVIVTRQGPITQALDGASGWTKTPRETRALNPVELDRVRSLAGSLEPLQLKEPYPRLVFAGREKIGDREANLLRMVTADRKRVTWYFDTQTGLLLRRLVLRETIIGPDPEQTDYEDYREVEGVKLPFSIRISYPAPNLSGTRKVVEAKTNEVIDASRFTMPK
jgi:hypothetical protein